MAWYAAHAIQYVECLDGPQEAYDLFENILLIEANTDEEALEKASKLSEVEGGQHYGHTWNDRPAQTVFAGIRKLILCDNSAERPVDGTEISYSQLTVFDKDSIQRLVADETVDVVYQSSAPDVYD